jgi:glycerophosphoryl diester phosphodiesterase
VPHPYFDARKPLVLGHRGAAGVAPENTLVSFARGLADGADIVESDVHITRDRVPVLMHDADVDRTTDGTGPVSGFSLDALQKLDAGARFSAASGFTAKAWRPGGERAFVPSLEQAFDALPGVRFNLEIKADSRALVEAVVALVQARGREEITLLTCGEDALQAQLREVIGERGARPALGASLADILEVVRSALEGGAPATDSMALQIPRDFAGRRLVTKALLDHAHAHGIEIHVWTINEPSDMTELLDLGVDGLVTDLPGVMADLREQRQA